MPAEDPRNRAESNGTPGTVTLGVARQALPVLPEEPDIEVAGEASNGGEAVAFSDHGEESVIGKFPSVGRSRCAIPRAAGAVAGRRRGPLGRAP